MSDTPYILHYAPDNASMIIRIALEEIGAPYVTRLVDRRSHAQSAPGYLALNPAGKIPVLETEDGPLFETGAILLWLADRHGTLAPAPNAPGRGDMLKWLFFLSNTLHPALRMLFYPAAYSGARADDQQHLRTHVRTAILTHLHLLDAQWRQAETPNVLDIYLAPMLRWLQLYPSDQDRGWFDLTALPDLLNMARALETRPSVHATQTAEGLGPQPFTAPRAPSPPEGSPT